MDFAERRTVRLEIQLLPWEDNVPKVLNYNDLIEQECASQTDAVGDKSNQCLNEDTQQGADDKIVPILRSKKGWRISDFRSLGKGYEEDSFIDNSETCDESVTSSHSHLGYRIRSKSECLSDFDSDLECESIPEPPSDDSACETDTDQSSSVQSLPNAEERMKIPTPPQVSTTCKDSLTVPLTEPVKEMLPGISMSSTSCQSSSSTEEPDVIIIEDIPLRSDLTRKMVQSIDLTSACETDLSDPTSRQEPSCSGIDFFEEQPFSLETHPREQLPPSSLDFELVSQPSNNRYSTPIPDSSSNVQMTANSDFMPKLSPMITSLLDMVMTFSPPDKKKTIQSNRSEILLKLGEECRILPPTSRMYVYEKVARHWKCEVKSVSKHIGRLRSQMDEQPVKDSLIRLRSQLMAEAKIGLNGESGDEVFTSADSEMVRAALRAKLQWLEKHPPRKGSLAEALERFVKGEVLPLWAPGGPGSSSSGASLAFATSAAHQEVIRLVAMHAAASSGEASGQRSVGNDSPRVAPALLHDFDDSLRRNARVVTAPEGAEVCIHFAQQSSLRTHRRRSRKLKRKDPVAFLLSLLNA